MKYRARIDRRSVDALQKKIGDIQQPLSEQDADAIGSETVKRMKALIAKGISPIRGAGKFPRYKDPKKYPGRVKKKYPSKKDTPVNLFLSGKFMSDLKHRVVKTRFGFGASVGYSTQKSRLKERGHREGANRQPRRPTIPQEGEQFAQSIQDPLRKIVLEKIVQIIKK